MGIAEAGVGGQGEQEGEVVWLWAEARPGSWRKGKKLRNESAGWGRGKLIEQ